MNSVSELMRNYFSSSDDLSVLKEGIPRELPIVAKKVIWKPTQDGNYLIRSYEFETQTHLRKFIDQVLSMQERTGHHSQMLIDENIVKIKVGTKSLNRITELDIEFASEADDIYSETEEKES